MFALRTFTNLCTTQSIFQHSVRTAKVFKPNLLISKHRNIKVKDGQWVEKDTVLTLQNNLVLYPGENTSVAYDYTIRSKVPGFVVITTESVKPHPHSPLFRYANSGNEVKRNFVHVLPPRREASFRLIDQIYPDEFILSDVINYETSNLFEQYSSLILQRFIMTVVVQRRDRCRICFSLLLRDRSICCQKSYDLFKHIERQKIPLNKLNSFQIKIRNQTVCFRDLILRYLHTKIDQTEKFSNFICHDCSMILLDIEQCAKYLRKTINQLKIKLNKSNRLRTSSLSATFQKKKQHRTPVVHEEPLPILNSDSDEEFDDIDDEEEFDDEQDEPKPNVVKPANQSSPSSLSSGSNSSLKLPTSKLHATNNGHCNDDDDDEEGLIKNSSQKLQQQNLVEFMHRLQANPLNTLSGSNGLITAGNTMNLIEESNPNLMQLRLAHMMAAAAYMNSTSAGQNRNDNNNNVDSMMNTLANMQRNFLLQFFNDPLAAAQATQQAAAAAAVSATHMKANLTPMSLMTTNNKQIGSCRKRKSTPEKRVLTNHQSSNNNDNASPTNENESIDNHDTADHPLELTLKTFQPSSSTLSSPVKSTTDIHNIAMNPKVENGSPIYHQNYLNQHQTFDEDHKESATPNDSPLSLSPSLIRRANHSKRQKISTTIQNDYLNNLKLNLSQTQTTDLLSPNHHSTFNDDTNSTQQKQHRKLDPRTCIECGKVLFSDKTLLLHCQTHAKNDKQCWICGANDNDIKKHIFNEHGNQKFTNTGFKCHHCEKAFPVYSDLETHTREHSKKKPFECPICNKRFGQQGNLSCHLRIHSGVKPFTCASCGKAFRHSNSLRRHARTVHSASRGLSMSPGSMTTIGTSSSSMRLATATTSNSMVSMANDMHHLSTSETFDDGNSGLMIPSDEAESLQGPPSTSSAGVPSPSISNAQVDSDSHEQFGTG
ncbi:unnamed protein product [Rotaria magnacalcarata]|uniref:C2H2-type domain-containing protein n=13 Tax=Rotaria magnacalcarata TaxID=392030 RepID=A0A816MMW3_9BILA|nr:unnamed protein product [Rotaria magnacalcarata]CAF1997019.1 unnamed protein product [Rotaria magnacalcarata]CAF4102087.1 unnamed protein product [Rotaria magnacalcarata]